MDPTTVMLANGLRMEVQDAYEKSKWCQCGHRHPKKSASSSGFKRQEKCVDPGCGCATFRTQASDAEMLMARALGKSKKWFKKGFRSLFGS